ncbi:MAG: hypothetical protein IPJ94_17785 [Chloroflexi bacterium]|nr:hypothetical protein [Chloroflexota bacterium]
MLPERIFTLITRLIYGRWTRHYDEHHSPYEDSTLASLGPFRLSANYCFVLDHRDAGVSLTLPLPGGRLHLSYTVCLGDEPIRPSGWRVWWQRPYRPTPPNASSEEFLL